MKVSTVPQCLDAHKFAPRDGDEAGLALRHENKWQMVLGNIPGLTKCDFHKGRNSKTLAESSAQHQDSLAGGGLTQALGNPVNIPSLGVQAELVRKGRE